jgi:hypothetical protein
MPASGAPRISPEDIIEATRGRRLRFMEPPLGGQQVVEIVVDWML